MNLEDFRATVETPSGEISYVDAGEGPVALFVHGVATNAYLWRNVVGELRDERRRIAIDLPLHGRSPARPDQDFSLAGLARVVEEVCEALGLTSVDLVANDTGGAVAQIFAARHPDRLRTFTLTNCDAHDNVPPEAFKPTVELAARGELAPNAEQLLANIGLARAESSLGGGYEHPELVSDERLRTFLEPVLGTPERARSFERALTALQPDDLLAVEPELKRLTVPTLVVWGTGDAFFDLSWAYWLRDTIPGVTEVIEIEGARTFFPDERPGDLVPHLRRFWARPPAHAAAIA
jgi:pimeloyl-ACP methyl ester carboxylesterase